MKILQNKQMIFNKVEIREFCETKVSYRVKINLSYMNIVHIFTLKFAQILDEENLDKFKEKRVELSWFLK